MDEGLLAFPDPRKLSVQEKNLLKIRSLEKEKKESLEVGSCELTEFCLSVEHCVITCPAFRVFTTYPKPFHKPTWSARGSSAPLHSQALLQLSPNSLAALSPLGQVCILHPNYRHPLTPPVSVGLCLLHLNRIMENQNPEKWKITQTTWIPEQTDPFWMLASRQQIAFIISASVGVIQCSSPIF